MQLFVAILENGFVSRNMSAHLREYKSCFHLTFKVCGNSTFCRGLHRLASHVTVLWLPVWFGGNTVLLVIVTKLFRRTCCSITS